eukprot:TRINITY_DN2011_c0_g1_i2.p2 TRINITY_DN2011_c0_g1~~TRINITY_DN2011_c0_g1_i2.p2  ORF type:complete len:117 (+),score=11.13 TRINITY_DN2011_c0_g1_i2:459-809(+)
MCVCVCPFVLAGYRAATVAPSQLAVPSLSARGLPGDQFTYETAGALGFPDGGCAAPEALVADGNSESAAASPADVAGAGTLGWHVPRCDAGLSPKSGYAVAGEGGSSSGSCDRGDK